MSFTELKKLGEYLLSKDDDLHDLANFAKLYKENGNTYVSYSFIPHFNMVNFDLKVIKKKIQKISLTGLKLIEVMKAEFLDYDRDMNLRIQVVYQII
jgi:hypothetical protein